ncbi:hypothetical protein EMIHUDRAFT_462772 [Emiliania huxleyi CCMP1516]|uniref:Alcohol dehydrogenase-like C-terminal domain-containing protein n=2 Tax=Emiliania huxleyi TaxID=2903 RepID=A0A0D3K913_EMIH1|nr:hypothetical protein EMIHUDRAFT_462772 [Emiliania huxleyi CCMP1516]EOD32248.1 hypothetical protein EMIHUDRAFT_462772 [Emiliania huxleyi CCMP1516]|eukprot:XP_005784677.1 hypothetical protein EMIHUDRAFT_462772 [Emiliania huxleyi CCMP1516]
MRRPPPRLALLLLASGSSATTEWRIAVLPDGRPFAPTDFALAPSPPLDAAALKQGEALFALEYASVDAATRIWTDGGGSAQGWGFFSKLQKRPGDAMFTFGAVLRCLASRHPDWAAGELGVGASAIRAVQVLDPAAARLRKALGSVDPSLELSVLGTTTGLTALLAIEKLLPPRPEGPGVVYVSAAAGGVGLLAAQLFQLRNATRVIGSAGTDEKVRLLRSKYGVEAFNYRRQAVGDALAALAPEGVDVFFDGVGGRTLDEALLHMSKFGTVLNVGAVSEFSSSSRGGLANAHAITDRALRISGFGVANYVPDFADARRRRAAPAPAPSLADLVLAGKLTTEETVFGWEEYGAAHTALHAGGSVGKVLVAGPVAAAPRGGGGGGDGGGGGGGGPEAVAELVVRAGASLGRDTAAFAHSLVHDHWVDSVSALRALSVSDLIALGLPGRLASLLAERAEQHLDSGGEPLATALLRGGTRAPRRLGQISHPHATTAKLREEMDSAGYIFSGTRGSWSGEDTKRNAAVVLGKSKARAAPCRGVQSATVKVLSPYAKRFKLGVATRIVKVLHRDDYQFAASDWPYMDGFRPEFLVGVMWAANEFTAANGATNVVPGSHKWPPSPTDGKRPSEGGGGGGAGIGSMGGGLPEGTQIVPGAMPEGSALFYLGSTLHGAGQHDGSAPPRDGLIFIYYLGWLNNLINFHFGIPNEIQKEMPPELQDLLGHASDGTDYDHPWIKGPLYTLPYQGGPGTLSSLTNADRAGAVR